MNHASGAVAPPDTEVVQVGDAIFGLLVVLPLGLVLRRPVSAATLSYLR